MTVCGIEQCLRNKFYGPSIRNDYHIHIVLSGSGTLTQGGQSFSVRRGQLFAIVPGKEAFYCANSEDPWHYTWVSFSGSRADEFMQKAGITAETPVRETYFEPEAFLAVTEQILDRHALTASNELMRAALLYKAVSLLVSSWETHLQSAGNVPRYDYPPDLYFETAKEYVKHNFKTVTVAKLSDYIGISRQYLTEIFQSRLKIPPKAYIQNYRLELARKLILETSMSIKEVSENAGYEDQLSFSKQFKALYGKSSSECRKKNT